MKEDLGRIERKLNHLTGRIEDLILVTRSLYRTVIRQGEIEMATIDDILQKVQNETTVINSIKVLVEQLKANQSNPAKLQEIVAALDANDIALATITNTDQEPTT